MRGKDWPNLGRMFVALNLLILSPLFGIAVGALLWGSLERGLLVFNLLGLAGFTLSTRPFWRGNPKRIRGLLRSALALGFSALLDILSGRPVPFAVYFSSVVECFSLIPWITEILNEIHRGQWRQGSVPSPSAPIPSLRRETPLPRPKPVYQAPEEPVLGFPRWGYPLLALSLGLILFLLLASCHSPAAETPPPSPPAVPTPTAEPSPTPEPTPIPEPDFPILAAENDQWQVYVDHYGDLEGDALVEFSIYNKEGDLLQTLSMTSPHLHDYSGTQFRNGGLMGFQDLNFDGLPDLWVLYENIRNGASDAFLWDEEAGRFVEELSFAGITGPCYVNSEEKLVFGCGSSSASSIGWSVHRYVPGEGYRLEYTLTVYSDDDEERPGLAVESRYENGEIVSTVESWDGTGLSDIWDKRTENF